MLNDKKAGAGCTSRAFKHPGRDVTAPDVWPSILTDYTYDSELDNADGVPLASRRSSMFPEGNVDSTASSTSASFIAPKEKLHCFTTIGQDELNKLITASKPTICLLDPVPTKLLKELLPVAEEPLLNIIDSSLSLGHVPKPFKLAVIKPIIKKPKLDPCELANYRPISNLPFMS